MKGIASVLGLLIVLGIVWTVFKTQFTQGPAGGAPPMQVVDVAGVKADLVVIGQAERGYLALHGSYASLEELQQEGSLGLSGNNHRGYNYAAEVDDGLHFKITASPAAPAKQGWPTLSIDESMDVTQQ
jgi:hypothetical protein